METKTGYIYKLSCNVTGKVYYGSTSKTVNIRLNKHISEFKNKSCKCCKSKEIICNGDFRVETLETIEYTDKKELYDREGYYIRNNECINKTVPNRTEQELREWRKKYNEQYGEQYREQNKEQISEKKKIKMTCECGSMFRRNDKARHEKSKKHQDYIANK